MADDRTPGGDQVLEAWHAGNLGDLIERKLAPLLGLPLRYIGRAGYLVWVGFGPDVQMPDVLGKGRPDQTLAMYALHLQCPFRLEGPEGPLLATEDMYHSPLTPWNDPSDFDPGVIGTTLFDHQAKALFDAPYSPRLVEGIVADRYGGMELDMGDFLLRVFPAASYEEEHWRFFRADSEDAHFVVLEAHDYSEGGEPDEAI